MAGDKHQTETAVDPLTSLKAAKARLRASQIADLERRKAALLAQRDMIDLDVKALEAKLEELQARSE